MQYAKIYPHQTYRKGKPKIDLCVQGINVLEQYSLTPPSKSHLPPKFNLNQKSIYILIKYKTQKNSLGIIFWNSSQLTRKLAFKNVFYKH